MRLILHAGTEKTGTTSIQSVLFNNREWLRQRGILYPPDERNKGRHHRFAINLTSPATAPQARRFLDEAAARAGPDGTILLSSEWLYSATHNPQGVNLQTLKEEAYWVARKQYLAGLATACEGFETEVVFFLRRPDEYAEAYYKTFVAQGGSSSFDTFVSSYAPIFEYAKQLEAFRSRFAKVTVLSYDASLSDVVDKFLRELAIPTPPATTDRLNRSTDARVALWMARENANGQANRVACKMRRAFSSSSAAKRLFTDFRSSTLWASPVKREEFIARMTRGLEPGFFSLTDSCKRETARLDHDTTRRITGAYRLWRLRSLLGLQ